MACEDDESTLMEFTMQKNMQYLKKCFRIRGIKSQPTGKTAWKRNSKRNGVQTQTDNKGLTLPTKHEDKP